MRIEIDPLLFFAAVIEDNLAIVDDARRAETLIGMMGLGDRMAEAAHADLARAQEQVDRLIAEDPSWRPA
jgi:hypothetical protein